MQNASKAKLDSALPKQGQESPLIARRKELMAQAEEIRAKQGLGKAARGGKLDQIKALEEEIKSRINKLEASKSKIPYRSVEEIDAKIKQLEQSVDSGKLKIVDEKKALAEITNLRKLRKGFSAFDSDQKAIDDLKAKVKTLRDSLQDPEAKKLSEEYNRIQAELASVKAELDSVFNNLTALRNEKSELQEKQQQTWAALKKHKDEYHAQLKAALKWEREARERRREREQAERERIARERKMARAQQMLAEASEPAFTEEIRRANNLVRFFDPSYVPEEKTPLLANKGLAATAQRKVDDSAFQGMKLVRKEDRDDEYLPAIKKGKKGKKSHASETPANKFSCPPSVIEDCAFVGVDPPMSAAEVPEVVEKVKAKIAQWKADQPAQTQKVFIFFTPLTLFIFPISPFLVQVTNPTRRTSRRPRKRSSASRLRSQAPAHRRRLTERRRRTPTRPWKRPLRRWPRSRSTSRPKRPRRSKPPLKHSNNLQ